MAKNKHGGYSVSHSLGSISMHSGVKDRYLWNKSLPAGQKGEKKGFNNVFTLFVNEKDDGMFDAVEGDGSRLSTHRYGVVQAA
jgi:hypothetical protein